MAKSFKVKVTQRDIDNSQPGNSRHCLVAEAIRSSIRDTYSVNVNSQFVRFNVGDHKKVTGTRYMFPMPGIGILNAEKLDQEGKKGIKPFAFILDGREGMSEPVVKQGPRTRPYKKRKQSKPRAKSVARKCAVRRYRGAALVKAS